MHNKTLTNIVMIVAAVMLLILLLTSTISIGRMINTFSACEQDPVNSFPCYGIYDIIAMIVLMIFIIACMISLAITLRIDQKKTK